MKKTKISSLLCAVVLILILGAIPNASAQSTMKINHGDLCTTNRTVSLDTNIPWTATSYGKWKYRAGETPNLVNVGWQLMNGPSVSHTFISPDYVRKTVYMEILNVPNNYINPALSDSIDYKQACAATKPAFRDIVLTISTKKYPERFKFDVTYLFYAARTDHDDTYQIVIKVIPEGAAPTTATSFAPPTTLNYTASQGSKLFEGIEYRRFTGTLTVYAPAQGELPQFSRLSFNVRASGGPRVPGVVVLPSMQPSASKLILLENVPYKINAHRTECTGAPGGKGDVTHGFGAGALWPVGQTVLNLNGTNSSATAVGREIKFDSNPAPFIGVRAVRFLQLWHWNVNNYICNIHWWCEGFSNTDRGANLYDFRYTINGNQIRVRVP